MKTFTCTGFRSVSAASIRDAAQVFANRFARRHYGPKGYAHTCNVSASSLDGTYAEFSAFVGYSTGATETTGHNFNFSVSELANPHPTWPSAIHPNSEPR